MSSCCNKCLKFKEPILPFVNRSKRKTKYCYGCLAGDNYIITSCCGMYYSEAVWHRFCEIYYIDGHKNYKCKLEYIFCGLHEKCNWCGKTIVDVKGSICFKCANHGYNKLATALTNMMPPLTRIITSYLDGLGFTQPRI